VKQRFRRRPAASRLHSQAGLGTPGTGQEIGTLASSTGVEIGVVPNQLARVPATGEHEPKETGSSDLPTHVGERLPPRIMLSNVHERLTIRNPVQDGGLRPPINTATGVRPLLRPLDGNVQSVQAEQSNRVGDNLNVIAATSSRHRGEHDMDIQNISALRTAQQGFRIRFNVDLEAQLDERNDVWRGFGRTPRTALAMASSGAFFFFSQMR